MFCKNAELRSPQFKVLGSIYLNYFILNIFIRHFFLMDENVLSEKSKWQYFNSVALA